MTFSRSERSRASYTTEGTTSLPPGGRWTSSTAPHVNETALMSFERWAPDYTVVNIDQQVHANRLTHHLPRAPTIQHKTAED